MSRLECIDDDLEEEIALRIKDLNLHILPADFDYDALTSEIVYRSDSFGASFPRLMNEAAARLTKLTFDYTALVMNVSTALDLDIKAAESRIAERGVPSILKKIEEET